MVLEAIPFEGSPHLHQYYTVTLTLAVKARYSDALRVIPFL
jgi:hypothetical protein